MAANSNKTQPGKNDRPNQPVVSFIQEASNLYVWCLDDLKELETVGITKEMIEELPQRTEVCLKAQVDWNNARRSSNAAQNKWNLVAPKAMLFKADLLKTLRFAFRNEPDLLSTVEAISKGAGYADLIQDLSDIAVLSRANINLLTEIGFDATLAEVADTKSDQLADLWAQTKSEKSRRTEFREHRNLTFWHLHQLVSEIRTAGKFVFRNDTNRLKGYSNAYWKRKNSRQRRPGQTETL